MIGFPYPLLMNAFNTVNLSAAVILTTTSTATSLGIPPEKWIYPLGGAGTSDTPAFYNRPNFHTSPSISQSLDAALSLTHLTPSSIDLFDFYSCFPIVPKLAAHHLGLPFRTAEECRKLSLLGGLTSFGGAGNNYSMHAITEMVRQLRSGKGERGLVLCNGGWLSYQFVFVLGREPRGDGGYPDEQPLPGFSGVEGPEIEEGPEGEAVVEVCCS
jgi:acetyl-CoA acetyltransferase